MRKTPDVHLIDDGVLAGTVQGPIALPIVGGGVGDNGAHGSGEVVIRPAGAGAFPEAVGVATRVGVDEDLIPVEPMAGAGIERAIHAVSVVGARLEPAHEDMPEMKGLVDVRVQEDRLERLRSVMGGEEEQFDTGGILREEREIDAFRRWSRPQGVRRALFDDKGGWGIGGGHHGSSSKRPTRVTHLSHGWRNKAKL